MNEGDVNVIDGFWWTPGQDSRPYADAIVVQGAAQYDGRPSSIVEAGWSTPLLCPRTASRR